MYRPKRVFEVCPKLASSLERKGTRKEGRLSIYLNHFYIALLDFLRSYEHIERRSFLPGPVP
ncbi:MAG: hypothetical protein QXY83_01100 [Thermosphaera sp.]